MNWTATGTEFDTMTVIARRTLNLLPELTIPIHEILMDLEACHCNGCPLDLDRMADAAGGDLLHDVLGIHRHLDHTTGHLGDCFTPRFAAIPKHDDTAEVCYCLDCKLTRSR
jgi:hypothetical protein